MVHIGNQWDEVLADAFASDWYRRIRHILKREYGAHAVYPDMHDIFNALRLTDYARARVVILGQDPYHGPGQAHGLAFSVRPGVPAPPSLVNIFKELEADTGVKPPPHGCLTHWATQGVLLLNTSLTVRAGQPMSHRDVGWQQLTDTIIQRLDERERPLVFMLWGAHAKKKRALITNARHLVLSAAHPSPLSAHNGFWGCRHFSAANDFLRAFGEAVDWAIPAEV